MSGLTILLPIVVTIQLTSIIINLSTAPFINLLLTIMKKMGADSFHSDRSEMITFFIKVAIIILFLLLVVLLGAVGRRLAKGVFSHFIDRCLSKSFFLETLYKSMHELTRSFFHRKELSFQQVVLVPFPSQQESYSFGFIPRQIGEEELEVNVLVPTSPNPTTGFLLTYSKRDLIYLNSSAEEAFTFILSCSMLASDRDPGSL